MNLKYRVIQLEKEVADLKRQLGGQPKNIVIKMQSDDLRMMRKAIYDSLENYQKKIQSLDRQTSSVF